MNRILVIFLLLFFLVSGSIGWWLTKHPREMECADIVRAPLQNLSFETALLSQIAQDVRVQFPDASTPTQHRYRRSENDVLDYDALHWMEKDIAYNAIFIDGTLTLIEQRWEKATITYNTVIECLGSPPYYLAYIGPREGVTFELWYPQKGLVIHGTSYDDNAISVDGNGEVFIISYAAPTDNPIELKHNLFYLTHPDVDTRERGLIKPFPSTWKEIIVVPLLR